MQQAVCPECHENTVPAPWMKCLDCCHRLVTAWAAERKAPKEVVARTAVLCAGVTISGNPVRCGRRADKSGLCKRHREQVAIGLATPA